MLALHCCCRQISVADPQLRSLYRCWSRVKTSCRVGHLLPVSALISSTVRSLMHPSSDTHTHRRSPTKIDGRAQSHMPWSHTTHHPRGYTCTSGSCIPVTKATGQCDPCCREHRAAMECRRPYNDHGRAPDLTSPRTDDWCARRRCGGMRVTEYPPPLRALTCSVRAVPSATAQPRHGLTPRNVSRDVR